MHPQGEVCGVEAFSLDVEAGGGFVGGLGGHVEGQTLTLNLKTWAPPHPGHLADFKGRFEWGLLLRNQDLLVAFGQGLAQLPEEARGHTTLRSPLLGD